MRNKKEVTSIDQGCFMAQTDSEQRDALPNDRHSEKIAQQKDRVVWVKMMTYRQGIAHPEQQSLREDRGLLT